VELERCPEGDTDRFTNSAGERLSDSGKYWTGDPGDPVAETSQPGYGEDSDGPVPPADELVDDPQAADCADIPNAAAEHDAGIFFNHRDEIEEMRNVLEGFDFGKEDGNFGIKVYCEAVLLATVYFSSVSGES
jgi:hypothetical protein